MPGSSEGWTFGGGGLLIGGFNLTCDGNRDRNLFIGLICARSPRRVFHFRLRRHSSLVRQGLHGRLQIVGGSGMSNPENALFQVRSLTSATCPLKRAPASAKKPWLAGLPAGSFSGSPILKAPVAQLDRALPSEGRGHRFESCRVRHFHRIIHSFCFNPVLLLSVVWLMLHVCCIHHSALNSPALVVARCRMHKAPRVGLLRLIMTQ